MKQLTYLFAFLLGFFPQLGWSQQMQVTQQGDFFNEINTLFANLNLNQLHTGLLLDKSR